MVRNPGTVSIMSAIAVELAFTRWIGPRFEEESGLRADVLWAPTTVLMKKVGDGERADVIIAIDDSMDRLARDGIIRGETRIPIAQALLGVAVKQGAARPDISTLEAFKRALLEARVAYSIAGASGIYFRDLIARLGIADAVNARAVTIPAGFTATKVASGEADLAVQQISELMSVEGVDIVGPFPEEVQAYTSFSAAAFTEARNPAGAAQLLAALESEAAVAAYEKGGLASLVRPRPAA